MVVLSYDTAKRSLIRTSVYLVCASLVIKGAGHVLEYNVTGAFQSMLNGGGFSFQLPHFNMSNLSFDMLSSAIQAKIHEIIHVVLPSTIGIIDTSIIYSMAKNKALYTGAAKATLKV